MKFHISKLSHSTFFENNSNYDIDKNIAQSDYIFNLHLLIEGIKFVRKIQ